MGLFVSIPQMEKIWHYFLDIVEASHLSHMALMERLYRVHGMELHVYFL